MPNKKIRDLDEWTTPLVADDLFIIQPAAELTKHYKLKKSNLPAGASASPFSFEWAASSAGSETVGTTSNNVVELTGSMVRGNVRSKIILTVTHNGTTADFDFQMTPYQSQFDGVITSASLSGANILINYSVGAIGGSIIFSGNKNLY